MPVCDSAWTRTPALSPPRYSVSYTHYGAPPPKLPSEPSASIRRRAVTRLASCNRATSQVAFQSRSHRPSPTFLAAGTGAPMRL